MYDLTNEFLEDLFNERGYQKGLMRSDVLENEDEYKVLAELPGVNKENIHLEYKDFNLVISYSVKSSNNNEENKNHKLVKRERFAGNFSRSFYLPNVDERSISASYKDGILEVVLLKKKNTNGISIEIK